MPTRLLLFCALLMVSASSLGVTLYKITDDSGVVSYSDRPGPGAKPLVLREPMVETLEGQVLLNARTFDGGVSFSARNELHVPVEVELRLDNLVNAQGGDAPRIVRRLLSLARHFRKTTEHSRKILTARFVSSTYDRLRSSRWCSSRAASKVSAVSARAAQYCSELVRGCKAAL